MAGPDAGGSFYLEGQRQGLPGRGATTPPDLFYQYDPDRDAAILSYARDLGVNMLRLESKISARFVEMADEMGIPLMYGWMCCNQWEKRQWDDEDRRVIEGEHAVPRSTCAALARPVFVWAQRQRRQATAEVLANYRRILTDLHWQNATVDTVSSLNRDADGRRRDGIQMAGPAQRWRPPSYWFSNQYAAAPGSSAEQGVTSTSRRTRACAPVHPARLWPINDTWFFHAGSGPQNSQLVNVRRVIDRRYGPIMNAEMFANKAQLAHYEATWAQFESFAANGWDETTR